MFIFFLQKKEFLNSDPKYLQTCLLKLQALPKDESFYYFYRDLLRVLFFEGLNNDAQKYGSKEIAAIIGKVPYVNGGIFGETDLEASREIFIPDEIFSEIFEFFESFTWHLDTRPTGKSDEINPEVLGYIFEQYINFTSGGKKENGAYYTQHDVTGYISGQVLVPRVLDLLQSEGLSPLTLIPSSGDRYINDSLLHGWDKSTKSWLPVDAWLQTTWEGDPSSWHILDSADPIEAVCLPGESWVELFHRRGRVSGLRNTISHGQVESINDLVTLNLNGLRVLLDVIGSIEVDADLKAVWGVLERLTIIDPTCGSGAFLFAALEILEELYSAVVDAAQNLSHSSQFATQILDELESHPNRRYFIRKKAAINNLFGTDLMPDAIETAKLRIFLALASCLDRAEEIEPLPDLDFNLKTGNLVLGFSSPEDALRISNGDLLSMKALQDVEPKVMEYQKLYVSFRQAHGSFSKDKKSQMLAINRQISDICNDLLLDIFAVAPSEAPGWLEKYKPLHWFAEYPEIMNAGGFDVVIGNPPYISKREFPKEDLFQVRGFVNENFSDFYVPCLERILALAKPEARLGIIVMSNYAFGQKNKDIRRMVAQGRETWNSSFGRIPDGLFTPARVRNSIILAGPGSQHFTTQHQIFTKASRLNLFEGLEYAKLSKFDGSEIIRGGVAQVIVEAIAQAKGTSAPVSGEVLALRPTGGYWLPILDFVPPLINKSSEVLEREDPGILKLILRQNEDRSSLFLTGAGKLGYLWWSAYGDDFHCSLSDVDQLRRFASGPSFASKTILGAVYDLYCQIRSTLLMASLNAGKGQVNLKWSDARQVTDIADKEILEAVGLGHEWRNLNIWYRQVMKSSGSSSKAFPVAAGAFERWNA